MFKFKLILKYSKILILYKLILEKNFYFLKLKFLI